MNLTELGISPELTSYLKGIDLSDFAVGRVTEEHRERYVVTDGINEYESEITGNLRFSAESRSDFPAVGDWVAMKVYNGDSAIIHKVLPRKSVLERQAVGKTGEKQIISANVDYAFIIQSIDNNFSINRLERYLTICYSANIEPVLILSKIDLVTEKEIEKAVRDLKAREKNVEYLLLSNLTGEGFSRILKFIKKSKTYCAIGSSGVGKSTLINNLLKKNILKTREISHSTNKGKHTTGHRQLFVLENGGIIIDTPGMRELGMTDDTEGIKTTFREIYELSLRCKFPDCKHISETGCAVLEALDKGMIDRNSLNNYQKMRKEQEHFESTLVDRRKKDREFGKMIKNVLKEKKKYKF